MTPQTQSPEAPAKPGPSRLASTISIGKDLVALLRDGTIFLLAMLLFAFPTTLNNILTNAGFEEGSLVGFKWKAKLLDADTALKDAKATITALTTQLEQTSKELADARGQQGDAARSARLDQLVAANTSVRRLAEETQSTVARAIDDAAPLVQQAQTQVGSGDWGVVFSGDVTLPAAQYEAKTIAPSLNLARTTIYKRQGMFRTVAIATTRAEADDMLPRARRRRTAAYIVRMSSWCPNPQARDGYQECQ
jgi:hypothetical protein